MQTTSVIQRLAIAVCVMAAAPLDARQGDLPYTLARDAQSANSLPLVSLPAIDATALRMAEASKTRNTYEAQNKRLAVAVGNVVDIAPDRHGIWQTLDDGSSLWRMNVEVSGATDLHLGFARFALPDGAALWAIAQDGTYEGPYGPADAGPLWLPMLPGERATLELRLPAGIGFTADMLALSHVDAGFLDLFARSILSPGSSGACNVNVVCPLGLPYTDETRALAYYEFRADADGRTYICTGTLLNDVPADRKAYLLTAAHCVASTTEVASMRVYWNYRSTQCATTVGYSFAQNQTGATLRATRADADFTLVELATPPLAEWNLFHAGWDASGIPPSTSIGLHHPRGDVAKVTAGASAPSNYSNCIGTGAGSSNTHWLTGPYTQGTTEGGSSGSGLWIPASDPGGRGKRLIGVLSGGTALCSTTNPTQPDNGVDCYGKFSVAWNGATAAVRLRDWLDPAASGTLVVTGVDRAASTATPGGLANPTVARRQAAANRSLEEPRLARPLPFDPDTRRRP